MELGKGARIILICAAAALIAGAAVMGADLKGGSPWEPMAEELRARGYVLDADDFYNAGSFPDSTIAGVLAGQDLSDAVAAGRAGGFPSDVNAEGDITLLLLTLGNREVVTVFVRDGRIELCFIQRLGGGVRPIG